MVTPFRVPPSSSIGTHVGGAPFSVSSVRRTAVVTMISSPQAERRRDALRIGHSGHQRKLRFLQR